MKILKKYRPVFSSGVPTMQEFSAGKYYKISDVQEAVERSDNKAMFQLLSCIKELVDAFGFTTVRKDTGFYKKLNAVIAQQQQ